MFNKPTVFIVGAGASAEFSLPTGHVLKQKIAEAVRFRFDTFRLKGGSKALLSAIQTHCNNDQKIQDAYTELGNELAATIHAFPSIDEALHFWSERPEIIALGKAAVTMLILDAERESNLYNKQAKDFWDLYDTHSEHLWLWHFLTLALSAATKNEIEVIFDNVTIINFNYDRVIEHYLYNMLQSHARVTPEVAAKAIKGLKIIRPYGCVGPLEWQDDPKGLPFGSSGPTDFFKMAGSIRTYTQQHHDATLEHEIDSAISGSQLLIFLGFGFHAQNMSLLRVTPSERTRPHPRHVMATVYGIHPDNYAQLGRVIRSDIDSKSVPNLSPRLAAKLLSELRPMIMNVVG